MINRGGLQEVTEKEIHLEVGAAVARTVHTT